MTSISSCIIHATSKLLPHNQFWILDFGANDHVCYSLNFFPSTHDIKYLNITFPSGHYISIKQVGNIHFLPPFICTMYYILMSSISIWSPSPNFVNLWIVKLIFLSMIVSYKIWERWRWMVWINRLEVYTNFKWMFGPLLMTQDHLILFQPSLTPYFLVMLHGILD